MRLLFSGATRRINGVEATPSDGLAARAGEIVQDLPSRMAVTGRFHGFGPVIRRDRGVVLM
jgi:hypothetical protein